MSHMSKRPSLVTNWQNEVYHLDIQDFCLGSRIRYWVSPWNQSLKRGMSAVEIDKAWTQRSLSHI